LRIANCKSAEVQACTERDNEPRRKYTACVFRLVGDAGV
jgi:hypothetical protein